MYCNPLFWLLCLLVQVNQLYPVVRQMPHERRKLYLLYLSLSVTSGVEKQLFETVQGLPGRAVVKSQPANAGNTRNWGSIPVSGRSPGEGNGTSLQYSCLENSMEPGRLQSMGSQRVRHDLAHAHTHTHTYTESDMWRKQMGNKWSIEGLTNSSSLIFVFLGVVGIEE